MNTKPLLAAYTLSGIGFIFAAYMELSKIGFTTAAYMQPADIKHIPKNHTQLSTELAYLAVYHPPFASHLLTAIVTTIIGHSRELLNLAKIYVNNAKYYSYNDSFIFKLTIFHDVCLKADILPKVKIKIFLTIFKSLAPDYYYSNISISTITMNFDQVCNFIKNYFEEDKYKQNVFLK